MTLNQSRPEHRSSVSLGLLILRLTLGVILFMHGAQKLLGWFGGHGFEPTVKAFGSMMHIPAPLAALSIFVEFFGGIALIVGFLPRLAAIAIAVNMLVAVIVSVPGGFFADKKGFEFPLGLLGIAVALILTGPGQYAILPFEERFIKRR